MCIMSNFFALFVCLWHLFVYANSWRTCNIDKLEPPVRNYITCYIYWYEWAFCQAKDLFWKGLVYALKGIYK